MKYLLEDRYAGGLRFALEERPENLRDLRVMREIKLYVIMQ